MTLEVGARPLSGTLSEGMEAALTAEARRRIARRLGSALAASALLGAGLLHGRLLAEQANVTALLLAVGALIAAAPVLRAGFVGFIDRDPSSTVD